MDWSFSASSGSWLEARQNPIIYIPLVIALAAIAVFLIISIVSRLLQKYLNLPPKSERIKKRITRRVNIHRVSERLSLTTDETQLLTGICRKYRTPNVEYFFEDAEKTYGLFEKAFKEQGDLSVTEKACLFSLLGKINKYRLAEDRINGLHVIPEGQQLFYVEDSGKKSSSLLIENTAVEMILSIPKDSSGAEVRPVELSKINLFYQGKNDIAYTVTVRVVRYQERLAIKELVVTHPLGRKAHLREDHLSIPANISCKFAVAKAAPGEKGAAAYEKAGDFISGRLISFSRETCNIAAAATVPIQQQIIIKLSLDGESASRIVGVVIKIAHTGGAGLYMLHIKYAAMDDQTRNYILAQVYGFVTPGAGGGGGGGG
ncbi:MAG: hypothetical protein LBS97_00775 [Treponema sp.]|jgi:hypothetical protein|nr:hypothetical protein [Treponema sp.]